MSVVIDEMVGTVDESRRTERSPAPPEDGAGRDPEQVLRRLMREERRRAARLRAD